MGVVPSSGTIEVVMEDSSRTSAKSGLDNVVGRSTRENER